jgi:hypothetical protein
MAGIGELNGFNSPYVFTDAYTALTKNTKVVVTDKERSVLIYGEFFGSVFGQSFNTDEIGYPLQFTIFISRTKYAPFGDAGMAKADIHWAASFQPMAGKAVVGVPFKYGGKLFTAQLLNLRSFCFYNHAISSNSRA